MDQATNLAKHSFDGYTCWTWNWYLPQQSCSRGKVGTSVPHFPLDVGNGTGTGTTDLKARNNAIFDARLDVVNVNVSGIITTATFIK